MKRKIYTADEEMGYEVIYMILFTVLWYSGMVKIIFDKGLSMSVVPFLLAGILPLAQAVNMVRKASCYRNFHKKCMQESCPRQGRIVNIRRKESTEERTGQRGTRRYRRILYYLVVEMINPENGIAMRITSEAYRIPCRNILRLPVCRYTRTARDGNM